VPVPKARLGVALLVPEPVTHELDGLRRALGDGTLDRIPPHLTLVPPVNVRGDRLDDALLVLRQAAAATRPFRLGIGPPASFLPVNPTLYLTVEEGADDVQRLRDRVFRPPLERPLTWPFVPHLTIADEIDPNRIRTALDVLADYRTEVAIDRVHLLEEGPGRVWTPIADVPFAAPAVIGRGGWPVEVATTERLDPVAAAFAAEQWGDDGRTRVAFTARRDGRVVGTATGWAEPPGGAAYLSDLIVDATTRGEGIGSHLLAAFESWAARHGAIRLRVRTEAGGRAEQFYRDRGWREEVRLPALRRGRDFVQLRRELPREGDKRAETY
jgi:2'-5' RNA ligase/GNAT superfamily N-acetyltransferase